MKIDINGQNFDCKIDYYENDDFYKIEVLNENKDVMGYATFKIKNSSFSKSIWLYKIETYNRYTHKGVGTAVNNILEYFAYKNKVLFIEGKFYPENKFAKPFYEKYGYKIEKDYYDTLVYKTLNYQWIEKEIAPKIKEYCENTIIQDLEK